MINPGTTLDLDWVHEVRVNTSAVERRTSTLPKRRTVKKEWQVAWYLRAITCMDLTTLAGDDTPGRVRRLCAKARQPVRTDVLDALGASALPIHVGAVCVYPTMVPHVAEALAGSAVKVCAVATGFPAGLTPFSTRLAEIREAIALGAVEIDVVITRGHVLRGEWQALYDEVRRCRDACQGVLLKVILATGELGTLRNVARASRVALMAGADFIKTSTGKEKANATLPVSLVMARTVRDYFERTGVASGFKPAGGISTARQAADWLVLMKEELGDPWLCADRFRLGASSLLADIERQLEFHATGRYSAGFRHPIG
ncbi:MAG TPA: deoxyribose-phosphate aldolase [Thermoanaerobaculia bacterium]|nr:deoxyribose-phosphate aldolase [Thermoanaerobaculia bacterium]